MGEREQPDLLDQLLDAADGIATISLTDLATLLRHAALDISALRDLLRATEQMRSPKRRKRAKSA